MHALGSKGILVVLHLLKSSWRDGSATGRLGVLRLKPEEIGIKCQYHAGVAGLFLSTDVDISMARL